MRLHSGLSGGHRPRSLPRLVAALAAIVAVAVGAAADEAQQSDQVEQLARIIERQQKQLEAQQEQIEELQRQVEALRRASEAIGQQGQATEAAVQEVKATPPIASTNPNVKVKLSGRLHRMIQTARDGRETDVFYTDSDNAPTVLRLDAVARPAETMTLGATLEVGLQSNRPLLVSQEEPEVGLDVSGRLAEVYGDWESGGKLSLGRGFMSSWVTPEVDLSGTQVASLLTVGNLFGGLRFVNGDTDELTEIRVRDSFADIERLLIRDRVRYDSPLLGSLRLSTSTATDGPWDMTLRAPARGVGNYTFTGAAAYQHEPFAGVQSPFAGVQSRWDGAVAARHDPTGVSLLVGGSAERIGKEATREGRSAIVKLGWLADLVPIGKTAFSTDYVHNSDIGVSGEDARSFGFFVVQNHDKYGLRYYLGYRRYSVNRPDINIRPISVFPVGTMLEF